MVSPRLGEVVVGRVGRSPVLVNQGEGRRTQWTLLTGAGADEFLSDYAVFAMLCALDARILLPGTEVQLPAPGAAQPRWLNGVPTTRHRPSAKTVIEAISAYRSARRSPEL
ncbi:hypothetical protein [Nocardia suismassiliense]|uniref:hypothetical protein n=1 Tax=Nocardia suismassiliense TaxID=2077092 RepID=UPI00131EDB51|nr:hypothetical protein [Nocardia suismassiliense]